MARPLPALDGPARIVLAPVRCMSLCASLLLPRNIHRRVRLVDRYCHISFAALLAARGHPSGFSAAPFGQADSATRAVAVIATVTAAAVNAA